MGQIFIMLHSLYYILFYSLGVKKPCTAFYEMVVLIDYFCVYNFKIDITWKIKIGNPISVSQLHFILIIFLLHEL